jgi:hypothetical protein
MVSPEVLPAGLISDVDQPRRAHAVSVDVHTDSVGREALFDTEGGGQCGHHYGVIAGKGSGFSRSGSALHQPPLG